MNPILYFIMLFSIWVVWSGMLDAFHLTLGLISCVIVYFWTKDDVVSDNKSSIKSFISKFLKHERYSIWLSKEIVLANIQVLKLAFKPKLLSNIQPQIIEFDCPIKSEIGQFVLAQSITLTPGTVTARIENGKFIIHAITKEAADALPGDMEARVKAIFSEDQL